MKKFIALSLITIFSASIASACIGGNLIQVIDTDEDGNKMVIANYNISTGKLESKSRSHTILSVKENRKRTNLCANKECSQLKSFENKNIKVTFSSMNAEEDDASVVINNVSVGGNVAVAKGMPRAMPAGGGQTTDVTGAAIYGCSKK